MSTLLLWRNYVDSSLKVNTLDLITIVQKQELSIDIDIKYENIYIDHKMKRAA